MVLGRTIITIFVSNKAPQNVAEGLGLTGSPDWCLKAHFYGIKLGLIYTK
jgi:hypothetical protein